jgi:hypothetical protein
VEPRKKLLKKAEVTIGSLHIELGLKHFSERLLSDDQ